MEPAYREAFLADLEEELNHFQWAFPSREENRGEVYVDEDGEHLKLIVYTRDNGNPDDERVHPLTVTQGIDFFTTPKDNIRSIIHGYLCHEADEQMWFSDELYFYPHDAHDLAAGG